MINTDNDPLFSSRMLSDRAKKTHTHSGLIAIASCNGGVIYLPFEISDQAMKYMSDEKHKHLEHMMESVKVKFLAAISKDSYK